MPLPRTSKETRLALADKETGTVVAISAISVSKSCGFHAATLLWFQDFRRLPPLQCFQLAFTLFCPACEGLRSTYISMFICVDFLGFHTCCHDAFPSQHYPQNHRFQCHIALLRSDLVTPMARCGMHCFVDILEVGKFWNKESLVFGFLFLTFL